MAIDCNMLQSNMQCGADPYCCIPIVAAKSCMHAIIIMYVDTAITVHA